MSKNSYRKLFKIIREVKKEYVKIGYVICPALGNEKVYFTREGFNHLIRKGRKYRSPAEIIRRLRLLPSAPNIVETATKTHEQETAIINKSVAHFWSVKKSDTTVIIRKMNDSRIHFFQYF